jgi:hypothetical protein
MAWRGMLSGLACAVVCCAVLHLAYILAVHIHCTQHGMCIVCLRRGLMCVYMPVCVCLQITPGWLCMGEPSITLPNLFQTVNPVVLCRNTDRCNACIQVPHDSHHAIIIEFIMS